MSAETIDQIVLFIHVVAGFITLASGVMSMVTRKGGKNHRRWGLVFFWSMAIITVSSWITVFFFRFNPFLFGVSILAMYMTFTGYRVVFRKRGANGQNATIMDWVAVGLATISALYLAIWGALVAMGNVVIGWSSTFGFLAIALAGFILYTAIWEDVRAFRRPITDKQWWWYYHMERMLGAFIGAVTAFIVQRMGDSAVLGDFSWVFWVLPGVIGGFGITYWVGYYRRKFNKSANHRQKTATAS